MKKIREKLASEAGFSFIEIMIVVVIIGFLASVVGPQIIGRVGKAKTVTAQNQIGTLDMALEQYFLDTGQYPTTDQGLGALRVQPNISPTVSNWDGPYLKRAVPTDPWGVEYYYKCPGIHNPNSYDLYSFGKDGQEGGSGEDADITNWDNVE